MAVGAPTFCRLPVQGHSVPRLFESDPSSDRMSAGRQRATCTRSAGRGCRSPVSRILSTPCGAGRSFLSSRRSGAPRLRGVRLIPGSQRAGRPFPVLSCTTRGFQCRSGCPRRGGLLPHHFTLACVLADHRRYAFCCTVRPGSSRFPSPTFVRRVALWCPDFPQPPLARGLRPSGERLAKIARRGADSKEKFGNRCLIRPEASAHLVVLAHE